MFSGCRVCTEQMGVGHSTTPKAGRHPFRTWPALLMTAIMGSLLLTGCSRPDDSVQVLSQGVCARAYIFHGVRYEDYSTVSGAETLTVERKLGAAQSESCSDSPEQQSSPEAGESVTVYKFKGISAEYAIAVDTGGKRKELFVTRTGEKKINPEVREFLKNARPRSGS